MRRILPFLIIIVVAAIAAGGGYYLFLAKSTPLLKIATGSPGAEPPHVRGGADSARVTLEEFGDFQCPPCGMLATTLLTIEHQYGDRIRVIFREFPLAMHAHAYRAATAAEAAGLQGKFWEMNDLLFEHAPYWSKEGPPPGPEPVATEEQIARVTEIFTEYATRIGLDIARFKKDLDNPQVDQRIKADQARGASIGVNRTPMLFIDGVQIPFSSFNVDSLKKIIDDALAGKAPEPPPTPTPTPSAVTP